MDYNYFLSRLALSRQAPGSRRIILTEASSDDSSHIVMAGGLPNPEVFPIATITLKLVDGSEVTIDEEDTRKAMQYGRTKGFPGLYDFVEELTRRLHDPPTWKLPGTTDDVHTVMVAGAQDGIYKTLECLIDEGDVVLVTEPVYVSFLTCVQAYGAITEPVKTDADGIIPDSLQAAVSKYGKQAESAKPNQKIKLLYCVPNADNPTGIRYSEERKKQIYKLAQEYNFIILEDDAYYFLEKRPLASSFLSMDVDGRVIRLDTFSKSVAPGFRTAYVTGPSPVLQKLLLFSQSSSQGCSSMSQVLLWKLFTTWGIDGFLKHCESVADFYSKRREACLELADKHLTGVAEWSAPSGGMFLWLRFTGIDDSKQFITERLVPRKVFVVAGAMFYVNLHDKCPYVRISFSTITMETMEEGFRIIAEEVKKYQHGLTEKTKDA